jgi:hypothetical protein
MLISTNTYSVRSDRAADAAAAATADAAEGFADGDASLSAPPPPTTAAAGDELLSPNKPSAVLVSVTGTRHEWP